ncbi:MAG: hypothetical protein M1812_002007 [Candelaria pacifica]|nr:MAG: hypothetical protein M1812_002007 [Candelaria pacifica]
MSSNRESKTTLMDQIRRAGELAHGPATHDDYRREYYIADYEKLLQDTPTLLLLPALSALLQSAPPAWFRPHISGPLSLLPTRPQGVRQIIEFLALMSPDLPPLAANENGDPDISSSQGPPITPEAIKQASKLLASVPSSLTPRKYFEGVIPQLLRLLDGEDGPDLSKAAGMIIAGDVGHKVAGWEVLAESIMRKIDPGVAIPRKPGLLGDDHGKVPSPGVIANTLVAELELERAITRLQSLLFSHLSLRLTKSLIQPLLLPLWAALCYAKSTNRTIWYERASVILRTYFKTTGGPTQLAEIAKFLMWDGRPWWNFRPGGSGGIEIRGRSIDEYDDKDMIAFVENIDLRVDEYIRLLASGVIDNTSIGEVFLSITKQCLLETETAENPLLDLEDSDDEDIEDPLHMLVNTKLVQQMLERLQDKLASNPIQILELARQLLEEYTEKTKSRQRRRKDVREPSYAALGHIVNQGNSSNPKEASESSEEESVEIVSIALSLVNAILSSPEYSSTAETANLLSSIQTSLTYLSTSNNSIPPSILQSASNLLSLLRIRTSTQSSPSPSTTSTPPDPHAQDRKTHSLALSNLSSPLPPIRAEGLSQISSLLTPTTSPILDIPATTVLLLSILQDSEEFIYLSAVRTLSLLANTHSRTVVRMLVDGYVDPKQEAGLDQRLRIGEALLKCIQNAGERLGTELARKVGECMLAVAGRRGRRPKTKVEKEKRDIVEEKKKKEAEIAWGGKVPQMGGDRKDDEDAGNEMLHKLVQDWEGKEGEEDVRVRTSALSILGTTIEHNVSGMGSTLISTAVDLAMAVLTLEKTPEKTILRRAAVLLIMSLLKALNKAREEGRKLGFGFAGDNLVDVIEVLSYVRDTDNDDLVKGHAETVIEGLETWRSKSLLGLSAERDELTPRLELDIERLAGLSVNPNAKSASRPRIEEVE